MKPLVGIIAYDRRIPPDDGWVYDVSYGWNSRAIEAVGGIPFLIPAGLKPETLRDIYGRLDAVMLGGGGDVDPVCYDAAPHLETKRVDPQRDRSEFAFVRWALEDNLPLLGICRGHQVINVALGGTLIQDIPSLVPTDIRHDRQHSESRSDYIHDVQIEAGSLLQSIVGLETLTVNSLHHQCVDKVAEGLKVTATAPDGVVEAVERPDKHFFLGVQWHPEDLYQKDDNAMHLFDALVTAARETMMV